MIVISDLSSDVIEAVKPLLDKDIDFLYETLGAYIYQIEDPKSAIALAQESRLGFRPQIPRPRMDFSRRGKEFLEKYWKNIIAETCKWWRDNMGKYSQDELISILAGIISKSLPTPWNGIAGILAIIAVILVRSGLETICSLGKSVEEISPHT